MATNSPTNFRDAMNTMCNPGLRPIWEQAFWFLAQVTYDPLKNGKRNHGKQQQQQQPQIWNLTYEKCVCLLDGPGKFGGINTSHHTLQGFLSLFSSQTIIQQILIEHLLFGYKDKTGLPKSVQSGTPYSSSSFFFSFRNTLIYAFFPFSKLGTSCLLGWQINTQWTDPC